MRRARRRPRVRTSDRGCSRSASPRSSTDVRLASTGRRASGSSTGPWATRPHGGDPLPSVAGMRTRRPNPEHQDAVSRRLALLGAELASVRPSGRRAGPGGDSVVGRAHPDRGATAPGRSRHRPPHRRTGAAPAAPPAARRRPSRSRVGTRVAGRRRGSPRPCAAGSCSVRPSWRSSRSSCRARARGHRVVAGPGRAGAGRRPGCRAGRRPGAAPSPTRPAAGGARRRRR